MDASDWILWGGVSLGVGLAMIPARFLLGYLLDQRWFWIGVGGLVALAGLYVGVYFLFGQWNPQLQQQQADLTLRVIPLDVRNYLPTASGGGNGDSVSGNDGSNSLLSRLGGEVQDRLRSSLCRVDSQNKIAWELKPTLTDGGWLVMRGQTKGGAQIRDPAHSSGGDNWAAFSLNNLLEGSGERAGRLRAVGGIYPGYMASRLGRGGHNSTIFAYDDDYRVTETEFYVRAKLPSRLLSGNFQLAVLVWPANPGFQSQALGAECVREE